MNAASNRRHAGKDCAWQSRRARRSETPRGGRPYALSSRYRPTAGLFPPQGEALDISAAENYEDQDAYELAQLAIQTQDCQLAVDAIESIQGALRDNPSFLWTAGQAYDCNNDFAKALEYFRNYRKRVPDDPNVSHRIAETQQKLFHQEKEQSEAKHKADAEARRANFNKCLNSCFNAVEECREDYYGERDDCRRELGASADVDESTNIYATCSERVGGAIRLQACFKDYTVCLDRCDAKY